MAISPSALRAGRIEGRRRRLLQQLLVLSLQRAVAFAEMDHAALAVAQHLDLDVARPLEIALEIDIVVARRRPALRPAPAAESRRSSSSSRATFMPRPPPPAAALIITGKPILLAASSAASAIGRPRRRAGHHGNARARSPPACAATLSPISLICVGRRADEGDAVLLDDLGEIARSRTGSRGRDGWRRRR